MFDRVNIVKLYFLIRPKGRERYATEPPASIDKVPVWLSSLLSIDTAPGEVFITSGWKQLGKLVVLSQPTVAYQYLWTSFKQAAFWKIIVYSLDIVLTISFLRIILNPLQRSVSSLFNHAIVKSTEPKIQAKSADSLASL